ncbi:hypothetical protein SGCZBJ_04510 [Caulobacter zeae]|uniref:Uncharacterized protein n=1 Tax=Caulobacter zeae TaxID=2055137 RepID=A0A2N5DQE2_9CAUL|nr:L,D-transpeptidase [Caulobacter zeae]PLR28271.1 hypothetical protein SGCZBJ_04510 [Caulobacter zeae]
MRPVLAALAVLALAGCGATAAQPPAVGGSVDRIVVEKAAHRMSLYAGDRLVRTYSISLGGGGLAPKIREALRSAIHRRAPHLFTDRSPKAAWAIR